jgi:recombination protein RecA
VSLSAPAEARWGLARLAGRIVEISGNAPLTAAFGLVLEAQRTGEAAAWITSRDSSFFPPDAALSGIDLESLPVVRVADVRTAGRAADQLVRSGGFGLVVIDLAKEADRLAPPLLTRLLGLAQKHETAAVVLTQKPATVPSLSSLVSLRAEAHRDAHGVVEIRILKDKRRGPGGDHPREVCRGPAGLR